MGSVIALGAGKFAVKYPARGGTRSEVAVCGGEFIDCTDVAELERGVIDGRFARVASRSGMMKSVKPGIGGSLARLAMGEFDLIISDKGGTCSVSVASDNEGPVASGA